MAEQRSGGIFLAACGAEGEESLCIVKTRRRAARGALSIVRLDHPNIASILDAGHVDPFAYVAMELIEGRDLLTVWNRCAQRRVAIPIGFACAIVRAILAGLEHVHGSGRVHGQIAPAKVMLGFDGSLKLLDFQMAQAFLDVQSLPPRRIAIRPGYGCPELFAGAAAGPAADIFAAGVILWELLVARPLMNRSRASFSPAQIIDQHKRAAEAAQDTPPSLASKRVPPEMDSLVMRALASSPSDRYATAAEFAAALGEVSARLPEGGAGIGAFVQSLYNAELLEERRRMDGLLREGCERLAQLPERSRRSQPASPKVLRRGFGRKQPSPASSPRRIGLLFAGSAIVSGLVAGAIVLRHDGRFRRASIPLASHSTSAAHRAEKTRIAPPSPTPVLPATPPTPSQPATPDPVALVRPPEQSPPSTNIAVAASPAPVAAESPKPTRHRGKGARLEAEDGRAITPTRDPEAGKKLVDAASAEFAKGRIAESHRLAKLAVKARGGVPALVILGDTYLKLGDTEKDVVRKRTDYLRAKRQYTEALRRESTDRNAQEGQAIITTRLAKMASPDADAVPPMARSESPAEADGPGAKK